MTEHEARLRNEKTVAIAALEQALAELTAAGLLPVTLMTALAYLAARRHGAWFAAEGEQVFLELGAVPGTVDAAGRPTFYGYSLELAGLLAWIGSHGSQAFREALAARPPAPATTWVEAPATKQ